jgi:hypothetical protein
LPAPITPNIIQTSRSQTLILIVALLPSRSPRYSKTPALDPIEVRLPQWRTMPAQEDPRTFVQNFRK